MSREKVETSTPLEIEQKFLVTDGRREELLALCEVAPSERYLQRYLSCSVHPQGESLLCHTKTNQVVVALTPELCREIGNALSHETLTVRVRSIDHDGHLSYRMTLKGKPKDGVRVEIEFPISHENFDALSTFAQTYIEKRRYFIPLRVGDMTLTAQIDVFDRVLLDGRERRDFVLIEIEYLNKEAMLASRGLLPVLRLAYPWIGEEVTGKRKYGNSQLAQPIESRGL